jgi:toxin ParE1/3/4
MKLELLHEAEEELYEAALWYESHEKGLGKRFRFEISRVLDRITESPLIFSELDSGYRRANCPVFPFYIPYIIRGECIIVIAVAHGKRKPEYWASRANE